MAQCLLHHGWLVLVKTGACRGLPIFFEVTTNWRAGCQKFACPVRREGRPESSSLPLSVIARTILEPAVPRTKIRQRQPVRLLLTHHSLDLNSEITAVLA